MEQQQIQAKITDEVAQGVYANTMQVAHTREEFIIDFMNVLPPQAFVNARVIVTPGHFKRIVKAINENLVRYEQSFGQIEEAEDSKGLTMPGFDSRKKK